MDVTTQALIAILAILIVVFCVRYAQYSMSRALQKHKEMVAFAKQKIYDRDLSVLLRFSIAEMTGYALDKYFLPKSIYQAIMIKLFRKRYRKDQFIFLHQLQMIKQGIKFIKKH